jgi:hypothetical protein
MKEGFREFSMRVKLRVKTLLSQTLLSQNGPTRPTVTLPAHAAALPNSLTSLEVPFVVINSN